MNRLGLYLEKHSLSGPVIETDPLPGTALVVIIPAFDEPDLCKLLDSLARCEPADCKIEILIGVNAPSWATPGQRRQNIATLKDINRWKEENPNTSFRLFAFNMPEISAKWWGAGAARKVLMDEAVRRFEKVSDSKGVIVSLDADCTVSCNYFRSIYDTFKNNTKINGAALAFEHPLELAADEKQRLAIALYELHMRYYYRALRYTGYPQVVYTIGSAFVVRADAYAKVGGMNRQQAGEDFYFIQKLLPLGGFVEMNDTKVYPSPRISSRVPFGTGPVVESLMKSDSSMLTYNPLAFTDLKVFFERTDDLFLNLSNNEQKEIREFVSPVLFSFLEMNEWLSRINEIRNNTSGSISFRKRFYRWFNMFRIVKFLNYAQTESRYKKIPVETAAGILLEMLGKQNMGSDPFELLAIYREMDEE